jgi:hypothetical protein
VFLISKSITLDPCPTTISTVASVPNPEREESEYTRGIFEYDSGASNTTIGSDPIKYPDPGLVIATLTICPLLTAAVPINSIPVLPVDEV